jgi:hypothetical protein
MEPAIRLLAAKADQLRTFVSDPPRSTGPVRIAVFQSKG